VKPPCKRVPGRRSTFREEQKRKDATSILLLMASASVVGYDRSLVVVPIPFSWYIQYSFTHVSTSNRAGIPVRPNPIPTFKFLFACPLIKFKSVLGYATATATATTTKTQPCDAHYTMHIYSAKRKEQGRLQRLADHGWID
jgi:hypothetical protein